MATYKSIRYIVPTEAVEHTDSINALSDVDTNTTAPTDGQILKWNNTTSKWYPGDVEEASNISTTSGLLAGGLYDVSDYYDIGSHIYVSNTGTLSQVSYSGTLAMGDGATIDGDKGFITNSWGQSSSNNISGYHLVSNAGVVGSHNNATADGFAGQGCTGLTYGLDKAIFGMGSQGSTGSGSTRVFNSHKTTLVSSAGVVASSAVSVSTDSWRDEATGLSYGGDKGMFIGGVGSVNNNNGSTSSANRTNLISNTGIVAAESACSGTKKDKASGGEYGGDKGIISYGYQTINGASGVTGTYNTISNTGVVSSDITGVGTSRFFSCYVRYGGDKGVFSNGQNPSSSNFLGFQIHNLVSNTGVIATDVSHAHDGRYSSVGCGYGS